MLLEGGKSQRCPWAERPGKELKDPALATLFSVVPKGWPDWRCTTSFSSDSALLPTLCHSSVQATSYSLSL